MENEVEKNNSMPSLTKLMKEGIGDEVKKVVRSLRLASSPC
jgi:hypothetical protein